MFVFGGEIQLFMRYVSGFCNWCLSARHPISHVLCAHPPTHPGHTHPPIPSHPIPLLSCCVSVQVSPFEAVGDQRHTGWGQVQRLLQQLPSESCYRFRLSA